MKKKHLFFILFTILLVHPIQTLAQNWFPLKAGNEWQFLISRIESSIFGSSQQYYLKIYSIVSDTVINNNVYFHWSKYPDHLVRYDETDKTIYIWGNDSDNVFMDFTLPVPITFNRFEPFLMSYLDATIIEGGILFNNFNHLAKGYEGYESYTLPEIWARNYFASDLGWIYHYEEGSNMGGGYWWIQENKLIQANIGGINYSENYYPEIIIEPVTAVGDSIFHLIFEVNHKYNHVFPDSTPHTSLNFIDTVKMHSYYSKGSTIVPNPVVYAESISGTEEWEINTLLDMNFMMNDYEFNYKIEAVDKGLVPHRNFAPDSGYFVAVWDATTGVEDHITSLTSFELYQNYPNPFNPSTKIKFFNPKSSFVNLKVYNVLGKEAATLVNEERPAGNYEVDFNATDLPSGVYFYRLQAGDFIETKKMVLLR